MKSRSGRTLVFVGLLIVLQACATRGPNFKLEDAQRVQIGMTRPEVVAILGSEPSDVSVDLSGELCMWTRVEVSPAHINSRSFAVKFKNGVATWIKR